MKQNPFIFFVFILIIFNAGLLSAQVFIEHTVSASYAAGREVIAVDIDHDGDVDFVTSSDYQITVWKNGGSQNFAPIHVYNPSTLGEFSIFVADINGDGDLDLVASSYYGNELVWYKNPMSDGGGNFAKIPITSNFNGAHVLALADIDGDGDMDIVAVATSGNTLTWWENQSLIMEMEFENGTSIPNGSGMPSLDEGTLFGNVPLGGAQSRTYTIKSVGNGTLLLNGAPRVVLSGSGASAFTVTSQPDSPVQGYGSTTFTITFSPANGHCGKQSAMVTIPNNTTDDNPYTFQISGNGIDGGDGYEPCSVSFTEVNAGGQVHTVYYTGNYQDYTIPENTTADRIELVLKGADGGRYGYCDKKGGKGAEVKAVFPVGYGTNQLRPGGTLRFIVGQKGESRNGSNSGGAGGGGGTGVLYKMPGATTDNVPSPNMSDAGSKWIILAVAGGGGGAYGNRYDNCSVSKHGSGGNTSTSGTNGGGDNAGGTNGNGGEGQSGSDGGAGGGYLTDGNTSATKRGRKGGITGGQGGLFNDGESGSRYGGWGYGGGGGACGGIWGPDANCGGGGGGGYSGGGGGNDGSASGANNGGGGGSFVNSIAIGVYTSITGNQTIFAGDHGYVTYAYRSDAPVARCRDLDITVNPVTNYTLHVDEVNAGSTVEPYREIAERTVSAQLDGLVPFL
jgi:hypothetical protein